MNTIDRRALLQWASALAAGSALPALAADKIRLIYSEAHSAQDVRGKLNLIVYNPAEGAPYAAPTEENVLAFEQYLWKRKITAILRKSKGQDIKAACGQLKAARQ